MEVRENSDRLQNGTYVLVKSQRVDMTSVEKRALDRMERNYFLTCQIQSLRAVALGPKLTCRWLGRRAAFPSALATEWIEKCRGNQRDGRTAWHLECFVSSEAHGLHLGSEAAIFWKMLAAWPW